MGYVVTLLREGGYMLFRIGGTNVLEARSLQSIGVCAEAGVV